MNFLAKLRSHLEIYKLEQRYTRRRKRRSVDPAQYIDGEYIYLESPPTQFQPQLRPRASPQPRPRPVSVMSPLSTGSKSSGSPPRLGGFGNEAGNRGSGIEIWAGGMGRR